MQNSKFKPVIFLFAGIALLILTGLLYKVYQRQKTIPVQTDRETQARATPAPLPPTVVIKARPVIKEGQINAVSLLISAQEKATSLSAISFTATLSSRNRDAVAILTSLSDKMTIDKSFREAGWQLIHNKVTSEGGKVVIEIAAVPVGKKFTLEKEQIMGTIAIKPISSSSALSLQLDPQSTKVLAGDAVTALPVISGN